TIVLVTHQMEDVANYADHMIVLDDGKIVGDGSPRTVFQKEKGLRSIQLDVPNTFEFAKELIKDPSWSYDKLPLTLDELTQMIVKEIDHPEVERKDKQVRTDGQINIGAICPRRFLYPPLRSSYKISCFYVVYYINFYG